MKNKTNTTVSNRKKTPTYIRMVIADKAGKPYILHGYKLVVDGKNYFGRTDLRGLVEEKVPDNAKEGYLSLIPKEKNDVRKLPTWTFTIDKD